MKKSLLGYPQVLAKTEPFSRETLNHEWTRMNTNRSGKPGRSSASHKVEPFGALPQYEAFTEEPLDSCQFVFISGFPTESIRLSGPGDG